MGSIHVYRLQRSATPSTIAGLIQSHRATDQVWLVVPRGTPWATRPLDIRRLAHAAQVANVDLRLVSNHSKVRQLARAAGISAHLNLPAALQAQAQAVEGSATHLTAADALLSRLRRPRHPGMGAFIAALLGVLFIVAVIAATLAITMPSAEVTIHPVTQHSSVVFTTTASSLRTEIDYGAALLPARSVQVIVEDTIQTETTGRIDAPEGYASGEVVFANRSESEVVIPKGTYVRTGSGERARFYTVTEGVLPAQYNATVRVPIMAVEPGPAGNVRALTINLIEGRLASVVEVINDSPTSGGTTKQVPMVTIDDQNAVYDLALGQLKERAYTELVAELGEGEFMPPETLETQVMSYAYGQALAERSEVTSITMKVVTRGTAIQSQDIDALATRFLESAAGGELSLVPGTLRVIRSNQVTIHGTEVTFDVSATGDVASTIDSEEIARALRGKNIQEAADWLNETCALAAEPEITLVPPRWQWLPVLPARTRVYIEVTAQ